MAHLIHNVLPMPPRKIVFINPEETVKRSINLMTELDIGALVVIDVNQKLIGIVSERDIVRSCLNRGANLDHMKAKDIAYKNVTILSPHDPVDKAMQAMTTTKRRHVLISENDEFIAILSIGDVLYHLLDDKARVIEQLENYIHTY
ncbi:MAG: CBS domain-containing protein [Legionella sp.]|nr:MAG: CBS domain-containing protein [Legionella sp.]